MHTNVAVAVRWYILVLLCVHLPRRLLYTKTTTQCMHTNVGHWQLVVLLCVYQGGSYIPINYACIPMVVLCVRRTNTKVAGGMHLARSGVGGRAALSTFHQIPNSYKCNLYLHLY